MKMLLELQKKLKTQDFNLDDFLSQLEQMKNMGPLDEILEMVSHYTLVLGWSGDKLVYVPW